jgi:hypothetical protein
MGRRFTCSIKGVYNKVLLGCFLLLITPRINAQISVTATAGTPGPTVYATLGAAINAVNAGTHQGVINISVTGSTVEPTPVVLLQS